MRARQEIAAQITRYKRLLLPSASDFDLLLDQAPIRAGIHRPARPASKAATS
jgi:hypothetical protein